MKPMNVIYDDEADALSIEFEGAGPGTAVRTEHIDEARLVDYDRNGELVAIEILEVSRGVELDGLPELDAVRAALEQVAAEHGWPSVIVG